MGVPRPERHPLLLGAESHCAFAPLRPQSSSHPAPAHEPWEVLGGSTVLALAIAASILSRFRMIPA